MTAARSTSRPSSRPTPNKARHRIEPRAPHRAPSVVQGRPPPRRSCRSRRRNPSTPRAVLTAKATVPARPWTYSRAAATPSRHPRGAAPCATWAARLPAIRSYSWLCARPLRSDLLHGAPDEAARDRRAAAVLPDHAVHEQVAPAVLDVEEEGVGAVDDELRDGAVGDRGVLGVVADARAARDVDEVAGGVDEVQLRRRVLDAGPRRLVVAGRGEPAEAAAVADRDRRAGRVVGDVERAPERLRVGDVREVLARDAALVGPALVRGDEIAGRLVGARAGLDGVVAVDLARVARIGDGRDARPSERDEERDRRHHHRRRRLLETHGDPLRSVCVRQHEPAVERNGAPLQGGGAPRAAIVRAMSGPSTRSIHAGVPEGEQGDPLLPGPVLAAPYHLRGDKDAAPYGYGRDENPSWEHLERALGELDGGESTVFASGMAAVTAVLFSVLRAGDVLVSCGDGYPGIRGLAREHLEPLGVEVRLVGTPQIASAVDGAALVWVETPSNPRLDLVDIAAAADAAHAAGALLAVDNTVCTPLGQQPLAHGADLAMLSGTKSLCGHSDVLLGAVSSTDPARVEALRRWRSQSGAIAGGFEAWLAHRSLATLGLRLARSSANAAALAALLRERDDVEEVVHPSGELADRQMAFAGPLVGFSLAGAERAQRFLAACELVTEATSFGGVHSTAERRGRWGTDAVSEGFIRFSAGCEDEADLLADVARALDASA